jgi:DNA repair protein RadC
MMTRCSKYPIWLQSGAALIFTCGRLRATANRMKSLAHNRFADPAVFVLADENEMVADLIRPHFHAQGEWLLLLCFGEDGRLLSVAENGGMRQSCAVLTPSMVRSAVSAQGGASVLLAHNHPSGDLQPSTEDIALTRQFAALCGMAGLVLTDHLILSTTGHFSFRAAGLV